MKVLTLTDKEERLVRKSLFAYYHILFELYIKNKEFLETPKILEEDIEETIKILKRISMVDKTY